MFEKQNRLKGIYSNKFNYSHKKISIVCTMMYKEKRILLRLTGCLENQCFTESKYIIEVGI